MTAQDELTKMCH